MIVRIVKLTFENENIASFEQIFRTTNKKIKRFEGCLHLELYQDKNNPNVFFTYSHWNSEQDLENYRNSEFFKEVWGMTKKLFSEKPKAWSLKKIDELNNT